MKYNKKIKDKIPSKNNRSEKKPVQVKANRKECPKIEGKELVILTQCIKFIDILWECNYNPDWAITHVIAYASELFPSSTDEENEYKCKTKLIELSGEKNYVREFFEEENMKRFEKKRNKICELCKYQKDYKDTGNCEELIFPIKNWKNKISKVV